MKKNYNKEESDYFYCSILNVRIHRKVCEKKIREKAFECRKCIKRRKRKKNENTRSS